MPTRPNTRRLSVARTALAGAAFVTMTFATPAGAFESDEDWMEADAGSLGVTPTSEDNTWCLADAGSFGLPNPVEACG